MKNKKFLEVGLSGFKMDNETGTFTCYGNVKGNIDHARDRTLDGAYMKSIERHMKNGTMPKMFWMHNPYELPVGKWIEMREDEKGLFLRGKISDTAMGRDIYTLMKDGAIDSFSIGYIEVESRWNTEKQCNDLIELDIKEISIVTFACNEESLLQDIKHRVDEGETVTKADLRIILKSTGLLSKRQIENVTANYQPVTEEQDRMNEIKSLLEQSSLCK